MADHIRKILATLIKKKKQKKKIDIEYGLDVTSSVYRKR